MRPGAKGWCPGARRPMASGDGLILRLRPPLGRLSAEAALAVCAAAKRFGSGILELTSRANLQLRGIRESEHMPLLDMLVPLGLIDLDEAVEGRRNILVSPLWEPGDDTANIAAELAARLRELPALPAKFGFAVDAGPLPVLGAASADIRIERARSGGLIVRADGAAAGQPIAPEAAVDAALTLARWFTATGGAANVRMARHLRTLPSDRLPKSRERPARASVPLAPGPFAAGFVVGAPFGQMTADALAQLLRDSEAQGLRLTPWRLIVLEGGRPAPAPDFIATPGDPLLTADACPGAPFCASATVDARPLARALAPRVGATLHISGCAKGCARATRADLTLVGRNGRFDLVRDGHAWDAPVDTGLTVETLLARYGGPDAAPV